MRSRRIPLFFITLLAGLVVVATPHSRAQESGVLRLDVVQGLALPPVDVGVVPGPARLSGSRAALRSSATPTGAPPNDIVANDGSQVMRGRVIVKFRGTMSVAARAAAVTRASRSAALTERLSDANFDRVTIDSSEDPTSVARALSQQSDVEYAQPVHRVHPQLVPNDPQYKDLQWNFPLIDMERAWDISCARSAAGACNVGAGSSILVAVIDTGVAYASATITATLPARSVDGTAFPALGPVTIPYAAAPQLGPSSRFEKPRDFVCGTAFPQLGPLDFDGHGTHVSGTIGQLTNDGAGTAGLAFNVHIMPIKVLASFWDVMFGCSPETGGTDDDVARAVRYAADNGANIINLSLGGSGPENSSPVMEDALKYAVGKGVFVAIAAGNDFEAGNPSEEPAEIAQRIQGVVSVASVDPKKQHSFFSSSGKWVELAAPGGSNRGFSRDGFIFQQTFDFGFTDTFDPNFGPYRAPRFDVFGAIGMIGTSQATPHVSGLAALLMQQGITAPAAIEAALEKTATDLGDAGRDPLYGFGLIEARSALRGLGLGK